MINPDYILNLRPDDELLEQCHVVTVADPAFRMRDMKKWCWDNKLSLIWSEIVETMDISPTHDHVAGFYFVEAKDATAFTLRFK